MKTCGGTCGGSSFHPGDIIIIIFLPLSHLDQTGHLLLQLQHEHPILAVLVEGVNDELSQVGAGAVSVDLAWAAQTWQAVHHPSTASTLSTTASTASTTPTSTPALALSAITPLRHSTPTVSSISH